MASDKWWTVDDDPAVFGPVAVEVKVGEAPRHQGDYLFAKWESEGYLKPGVEREESLLLLGRDGKTIEIDPGYVIQVRRPQGDDAGKVVLHGAWRSDALTPTRESRSSLRMRPTREQLAHHFPPMYGEADLAERVLTITDAELERIGDLAGYYAWSEEAFELLGGSMGGTRAVCLATIDVLEGTMRDPRQSQTQQELDWGTPEGSDVQLAQERSLRVRATTEKQPPFDADPQSGVLFWSTRGSVQELAAAAVYWALMPIPEYDEDRAKSVKDWADVPGAPDVLHDLPTSCIFCGQFIAITEVDPLLVTAKPWQQPERAWLYAAPRACLDERADRSGTR
jgi:hypothetical protein